jgi:hypothetical protein
MNINLIIVTKDINNIGSGIAQVKILGNILVLLRGCLNCFFAGTHQ